MRLACWVLCVVLGSPLISIRADDPPSPVASALAKPILTPDTTTKEVQAYCTERVPKVPKFNSVAEWEAYAQNLRAETLANAVYRGQAAAWRDATLGVEYLDYIEGGPGYKIRKLRYEALPGLWIPALLYLPEKLEGKVPVALNVNGHDPNGKAADYKQLRCINQAKRGMIALNPEWFNMGQFAQPDYVHYRLNQLDLCGTSGLAPFYLSMKRGLDILLSQPNADPARVAVSGLSGGGWQTIIISSLDPRVTLTNPVAGYSSFLSRIGARSDLGDSEQQPADLGLTADYTHLTALMAPRPTLLTYNAKDNCCFVAASAMPPLLEAAEPVFKLYGKEANLRTHVNDIPGDHNFGQENREAHYRMLGDHFFAGQQFDAHEIPSGDEVKSKDQLHIPLPEKNASLHSLAMDAMRDLPRDAVVPSQLAATRTWQESRRKLLERTLHYVPLSVQAESTGTEEQGDAMVTFLKLKLGWGDGDSKFHVWTLPATKFEPPESIGTTVILADAGRKSLATQVQALLKARQRVVAVDPFYFGEAAVGGPDFLYGILISAVGNRPLGIQAAQLTAICDSQWEEGKPLTLQAHGPRTSLMALCAAAVHPHPVNEVKLHGSFGSLKEIIEQNKGANDAPELFCFALLEQFDIKQLAALCAPKKVTFPEPSPRVLSELAGLKGVYAVFAIDYQLAP